MITQIIRNYIHKPNLINERYRMNNQHAYVKCAICNSTIIEAVFILILVNSTAHTQRETRVYKYTVVMR